jgi:hypothetical protein
MYPIIIGRSDSRQTLSIGLLYLSILLDKYRKIGARIAQIIRTYRKAKPVCFSIFPISIIKDLRKMINTANREIMETKMEAINRYEKILDS